MAKAMQEVDEPVDPGMNDITPVSKTELTGDDQADLLALEAEMNPKATPAKPPSEATAVPTEPAQPSQPARLSDSLATARGAEKAGRAQQRR